MTASPPPDTALPPVVDEREWRAAHESLLVEEKALTRARDALAARRRRMPMTAVDRTRYRFAGPDGEVDLLGLFAGRRQLVVYRFFFQPDVDGWPEKACGGCSFIADHLPRLEHLHDRNTSFVLVSPADQERIAGVKRNMGWTWDVPWFTMLGNQFDQDFDVAEYFGYNVFIHDDAGAVYRTYFANARGAEPFTSTQALLELTPLGRQEEWEDTPAGRPQGPAYRGRRHDEY